MKGLMNCPTANRGVSVYDKFYQNAASCREINLAKLEKKERPAAERSSGPFEGPSSYPSFWWLLILHLL
jgi:hypothetical protein